jgi:hypothetical protein
MSSETDEVRQAASELLQSMTRLVRAMDAVGDDGEAAKHISDATLEALDELASRTGSAKTFGS